MIPKFRLFSEKYGMQEVTSMSFSDDNIYASFVDGINAPIRVKNPILMQSTGVKDNNGVEIFEGHIVQFKYENHSYTSFVFFEDGVFKIEIKDYMIFALCEFNDIEVIGNIYENNDFLEG